MTVGEIGYWLREKVTRDWPVTRWGIGRAQYGTFLLARLLGASNVSLQVGATLYSSNVFPGSDEYIAKNFSNGLREGGWLCESISQYLEAGCNDDRMAPFYKDPGRILGSRLLVIKPWSNEEKGLLALDYNAMFPVFVQKFDVKRIAERYRLYAEPSWTGVLCPEVLSLSRFPGDVFCAAFEPRDARALEILNSNLLPQPTLGSCAFIDDEFFVPDFQSDTTYDVVVVAQWARFKRYSQLFRCLRRLSTLMPELRVACVGYAGDLTIEDIEALAAKHGVTRFVEFFDSVSSEEVRRIYQCSRLNVLWSRREGTGRAPFEGLFCGVPLILRKGFNYGHGYEFMRPKIGLFADESDFPETALGLLREGPKAEIRDWSVRHLSPTASTKRLQVAVRAAAESQGEIWTRDLAVRVKGLHGQRYQDSSLASAFDNDYEYLKSCIVTKGGSGQTTECLPTLKPSSPSLEEIE
jgi:glycosyltransferase involved in cell wall biosynthesis